MPKKSEVLERGATIQLSPGETIGLTPDSIKEYLKNLGILGIEHLGFLNSEDLSLPVPDLLRKMVENTQSKIGELFISFETLRDIYSTFSNLHAVSAGEKMFDAAMETLKVNMFEIQAKIVMLTNYLSVLMAAQRHIEMMDLLTAGQVERWEKTDEELSTMTLEGKKQLLKFASARMTEILKLPDDLLPGLQAERDAINQLMARLSKQGIKL